jgi:hypothetical protein
MGAYYALSLQKPPQKKHYKSPLVKSKGLIFAPVCKCYCGTYVRYIVNTYMCAISIFFQVCLALQEPYP